LAGVVGYNNMCACKTTHTETLVAKSVIHGQGNSRESTRYGCSRHGSDSLLIEIYHVGHCSVAVMAEL